jgi:nickel-dependent lactate racemase
MSKSPGAPGRAIRISRSASPPAWQIDQIAMQPAEPISREAIHQALLNPVGTPPLAELARGKRSCGIAIDDIARPTPTQDILELMVEELRRGGLDYDQITVFIGSGAHRTPLGSEVRQKLGDKLMRELRVFYHFPYENLIDLGHTPGGVPIQTCRQYYETDLHLSVGGITPHDFAGFGGGYKTVAVGLSGLHPLHHTHIQNITELNAGVAKLDGNLFQEYLIETGKRIGVHYVVNVVLNARRGVVAAHAGCPVGAFHKAAAEARRRYATPCGQGYDVAILNAYPKDLDLVQTYMALNVCFFGNEDLVNPGGTVVVTSPAPDGSVIHLLGGVGMIGYVVPTAEAMRGRQLIIFSPNLNRHDIADYFPAGSISHQEWDQTRDWLLARHGAAARAVVVDCASQQLIRQSPEGAPLPPGAMPCHSSR